MRAASLRLLARCAAVFLFTVLLVVAPAASLIPAGRAVRIDPMSALRA